MKNIIKGKVSIVTGAGTGIGEGIATVFAEQGSRVVVSDFNKEAGEKVTQKLKDMGADATYVFCDVAVAEQVEELVNETVKKYGKLDVIVNNAGYLSTGNVVDTPNEEWDKGIAVDLTGVFYGCKYAVKAMLKNEGLHKGSIINVSSVSGLFGDYSFTWYNAAKGGVSNMTRAIAIDFFRQGIRCNAINPGLTYSEICKGLFEADPRTKEGVGRNYPGGRPGTPREVANCALFLASDMSSIVNGVNLVCDGGITSHTGQPAYPAMDEYLAREFREPAKELW